MKFLIDMALSPKTAEFLRSQGYEAIRVSEIGMAKAKDREIFGYARINEMVLISMDLDFGHILSYTKFKKPSVIILRLKDPSPEHVNSLLSVTIPQVAESLQTGAIVVIEDRRVRIRELPL